ncbi:MAG: hypothetical protein QHH02_06520, partial [Syntrophomonadaceae bacterium]|nr:hypothetical protein [Syntrophomonadaceae bacterium]
LALFFRDHTVSDLIGFVYHRWFTADAVSDLLHRLSRLAQELPPGRPNLISIILDGENAWEYYYRQGYDFLTGVYRGLVEHPLLEMITFSEYLRRYPVPGAIRQIFPGSWINADFGTWVGQPAKNRAWDYLAQARAALEEEARGNRESGLPAAEKEMLIAEGSDWFWWFGDTHTSALDSEFDELFRRHLRQVYKNIGQQPPAGLSYPLAAPEPEAAVAIPQHLIKPSINGRAEDEEKWKMAGEFSFRKGAGAMQRSQYLIERIRFGFDQENLYLRLEGGGCDWLRGQPDFKEAFGHSPCIRVDIHHQEDFQLRAAAEPGEGARVYLLKSGDGETGYPLESSSLMEVLEMAVPLEALGLHEHDEFRMRVVVANENGELERWPSSDYISVRVPSLTDNTASG